MGEQRCLSPSFFSLSLPLSPFIALDAPSSSLALAPRPSSDREARARFLVMNSQPEHGSWRLRFNGTRFDRLDRIDSVDSTKSFDGYLRYFFFFFFLRSFSLEELIRRIVVKQKFEETSKIEGTFLIQFQCRELILCFCRRNLDSLDSSLY